MRRILNRRIIKREPISEEDRETLRRLDLDANDFSRLRSRGELGGLISHDSTIDNYSWADKDSVISKSNIVGSHLESSVVELSNLNRTEAIRSKIHTSELTGYELDTSVRHYKQFSNTVEDSHLDRAHFATSKFKDSNISLAFGSYANLIDTNLFGHTRHINGKSEGIRLNGAVDLKESEFGLIREGYALDSGNESSMKTFKRPGQEIRLSQDGTMLIHRDPTITLETAKHLLSESKDRDMDVETHGHVDIRDGKLHFSGVGDTVQFSKDVLELGIRALEAESLSDDDLEDLKEDGLEL